VSGANEGRELDLRAVAGAPGDGGVPHGAALTAFGEAALGRDAEALRRARSELAARLGPAGVVDAAAVVATFEMMDRVADATGVPLDTPVVAATAGLRRELGIDRFASAANTPALGAAGRLLGPLLERLAPRLLPRLARRMRGRRPS
jgi:hypothetical protein